MTTRPPLYLIDGDVTEEQRRVYRLRQGRAREALAPEPWPPRDGEWRELIRRLTKNPVKP